MRSHATLEKMDGVSPTIVGTAKSHRLLSVMAGDQEFLLRPDCVRSIYQVASQDPNEWNAVETPDGKVPTSSLFDGLKLNFGNATRTAASERTVIVFHHDQSLRGLRVHSVSRPVEIDSHQIFGLPPIVHQCGQASCLDSIALVHDDRHSSFSDSIRIIIDPLIAIGFREKAQSLANASISTVVRPSGTVFRDRRAKDPILRAGMCEETRDDRGNAQLIAFSPRTPMPAEMFFRFCLPMSAIAEVLLDQTVFPIPSASSIVSGYLVWRSQPIPVIDLGIAFGQVPESGQVLHNAPKGRILIARLPGGLHVALPTEMQIQVLRTPRTTSVDFPAIAELPHLGAFPDSSGPLVIPDLYRILSCGHSFLALS